MYLCIYFIIGIEEKHFVFSEMTAAIFEAEQDNQTYQRLLEKFRKNIHQYPIEKINIVLRALGMYIYICIYVYV